MPSSLFTFDFSVAVELYWSIRVTTGSRERKPKFLWCYHSAQVALTAARARVKKGRTAEQIIQKIREAEVLVPGAGQTQKEVARAQGSHLVPGCSRESYSLVIASSRLRRSRPSVVRVARACSSSAPALEP